MFPVPDLMYRTTFVSSAMSGRHRKPFMSVIVCGGGGGGVQNIIPVSWRIIVVISLGSYFFFRSFW